MSSTPACIVYQNMCTQVIKFIAAEESGPVCVSEMDKGILRYVYMYFIQLICTRATVLSCSLKECITTLQAHIMSLQNKVQMSIKL